MKNHKNPEKENNINFDRLLGRMSFGFVILFLFSVVLMTAYDVIEVLKLKDQDFLFNLECFILILIFISVLLFLLNRILRCLYIKRYNVPADKELEIIRRDRSYFFTALIILIIYIIFTTVFEDMVKSRLIKWSNASKKENFICSRKERIESVVGFEEALNIIERETLIHPELGELDKVIPCIHIKRADLRSGTGNLATTSFDSNNIQENFYPIYIDINFDNSDPEVTAALLFHPLYLAYSQALNKKASEGSKVSCMQRLVNATYFQSRYISSRKELFDKIDKFRLEQLLNVLGDKNYEPSPQEVNIINLSLLVARMADAYDNCGEIPENKEADIDEYAMCLEKSLYDIIEDFVYSNKHYREFCAHE